MSFATMSEVAHLANSAGWSDTGPSDIHEREPLMSCAINGVTSNKSIMPQ